MKDLFSQFFCSPSLPRLCFLGLNLKLDVVQGFWIERTRDNMSFSRTMSKVTAAMHLRRCLHEGEHDDNIHLFTGKIKIRQSGWWLIYTMQKHQIFDCTRRETRGPIHIWKALKNVCGDDPHEDKSECGIAGFRTPLKDKSAEVLAQNFTDLQRLNNKNLSSPESACSWSQEEKSANGSVRWKWISANKVTRGTSTKHRRGVGSRKKDNTPKFWSCIHERQQGQAPKGNGWSLLNNSQRCWS